MITMVQKMEIPLRNAALFALSSHHLFRRTPRSRALDVVDEVLGLNAQGSLNVQLSLWNRVDDLNTEFIPESLYGDRSMVKTWVMRDTVHVITTKQFPIYRRALERSLMMEWNRWTVRTGTKESATSWEPFYSEVLDILEDGPLTIREMQHALGWTRRERRISLSRLVREMSLRGLLCHAHASGPWYHSTKYTFARVDKWLPSVDLDSVSEGEALLSLAQSYLRAYGPASIGDFAYWTGMRVRETRPVFDSLSDSLVEVKVAEHRGTLLILEEDASALLGAEEVSAPARLLPQFDALIMGHKDKTRFIEPGIRSRIFLPRGDVAATIMIDGRVQGTWTLRKMKNLWRLELSPFNKLSEENFEEVEAEVDQLRTFTGFEIEACWDADYQTFSP